MSPLHVDKISLDIFKKTLVRYPETASSTLAELDTLRYERVPAKLAKDKKDAHLLKTDVEKLVEWKLKHGTFRPALMNLAKSNPADLIKSTTQEGFQYYADNKDTLATLKILTKLRGIGPATASLLLSVYQPDEVPFFSDELFRWTHWDSPGNTECNWDRSIKYNVKEYKEILASIEELRKRLGVKAVDAEKVAYVLGKERAELDMGVETEGDAKMVMKDKVRENREEGKRVEDAEAESKKRVMEAIKKIREEKAEKDTEKDSNKPAVKDTEKRSTKRKTQEEKAPSEGTRRSTRRKV